MDNISSFSFKDNEVSDLTKIIRFELATYQKINSPFFEKYMSSLNTVIGLGFAAMIINHEDYFLSVYQENFNRFIANRVKTREALSDSKIDGMAESTAKMVELAYTAFQYIQIPRFYDDFLVAFHTLLDRLGVHDADKQLMEISEQLSRLIVMPKSRQRW